MSGRDIGRRNAGIDGEARSIVAHRNRAVHRHGVLETVGPPRWRQQDGRDAGCDQIARLYETPELRIILDHDIVGGQRRPADILVATAPIDPCGTPFVPRNPYPTVIGVEIPPTVVVRDPAPIGFLGVGYPVPAIVVRIDPMAGYIWTPVARDISWCPDVAEA